MSLEQAPDEVKLAVDLIMLLEDHDIPAETVLKALDIVHRDFATKQANRHVNKRIDMSSVDLCPLSLPICRGVSAS